MRKGRERSWKDKLNSLSYSNYPNTSRWRWGGKNIFSFCLFQINFCTFRARLLALTDLITHSQASVRAAFISTKPSSWQQRVEWVYVCIFNFGRNEKMEKGREQASTKKLKEEFDMSCEIKQTFSSVWIQQWYMYHFVVIWYKQLTSRGGIYLKRLSLTKLFPPPQHFLLHLLHFYPCK